MADYAKDVLVDTQWVEDHLDDDSIRIVEVDENPGLYEEAHIPGRDRLRLEEGPAGPGQARLPRPEGVRRAVRVAAGISNDHTIVLYGDRNNWFAAYTYWYLKYYGHDDVKLVNGPREKWISEGRPTSTDVPSFQAHDLHRPGGRRHASAPSATRSPSALDADTRLVDVRSPQEFSGELIAMAGYEQEGAQRSGHIPGAASVPWAQAVQEDGTFKSADELRELYERQGRARTATPT